MKATIKGKEYDIEAKDMTSCQHLSDDLKARGWDGIVYIATGKRGAIKMAYRSAKSGQFVIV